MLAVVAKKGGTLADSLLFDLLATAGAGLSIFTVHLQLLGKIAGIAVTLLEVLEGGSTLLDCGLQYPLYMACKGLILIY